MFFFDLLTAFKFLECEPDNGMYVKSLFGALFISSRNQSQVCICIDIYIYIL